MLPDGWHKPADLSNVAYLQITICYIIQLFRRDTNIWGGGVFICVKNYIACLELRTDKDFKMVVVEVKDRNTKFTWKILASAELQTRTCEL
jgi:hypothetical protein